MPDANAPDREASVDGGSPPSSTDAEAATVLRRASPLRLVLKVGGGVAVLVALVLGARHGYHAYRVSKAHGLDMIRFAGGQVTIGNDARGRDATSEALSERPAHSVQVAAFELDATEVPVWAYRVCVQDEGCQPPPKQKGCTWAGGESADTLPVNCLSHDQAAAFCAWANKRLPTEVEWETAAGGADDKRMFPWGNEFPAGDRANLCGTECGLTAPSGRAMRRGKICNADGDCRPPMIDYSDPHPTAAPVRSYPAGATPEGLHDMAGNLWEWTSSSVCTYPAHDCAETPERIIRGGGFTHRYLLSAEITTRSRLLRTEMSAGVGFRCAR